MQQKTYIVPSLLGIFAAIPLALAFCVPYGPKPISTFPGEWLAALGWLMIACGLITASDVVPGLKNSKHLGGGLLLLALPFVFTAGDLIASRVASFPLAILFLGYLVTASLLLWVGFSAASALSAGRGKTETNDNSIVERAVSAVLIAFLASGVINGIVGFIQYFGLAAPAYLVAPLSVPGRIYGNVRQPNLYSLLLSISTVILLLGAIVAPQGERSKRSLLPFILVAVFLGAASALSGSRTGAVLLWVIAITAASTSVYSRKIRILAVIPAVSHAIGWSIYVLVDRAGYFAFFGAGRTDVLNTDISGSRLEIWRGMRRLIEASPWIGVGHGNLNYAYFLAEIPNRLTFALYNAHNVVLQIAVEHGIAMTCLWLGAVFWVIWLTRHAWREPLARLILVFLTLMAIHSLLEFPLWYTSFLYPTAFALGWLLSSTPGAIAQVAQTTTAKSRNMASFATGLIGLSILVYLGRDYQKVVPIFEGNDQSVMERLQSGYGSSFFSIYADYGVVTNTPVEQGNIELHKRLTSRVSKVLLDDRILFALALSSAASGDQMAKFYVDRLDSTSREQFNAMLFNARAGDRKMLDSLRSQH
jgi:O-antigen ligase